MVCCWQSWSGQDSDAYATFVSISVNGLFSAAGVLPRQPGAKANTCIPVALSIVFTACFLTECASSNLSGAMAPLHKASLTRN
jgi:hypothetical protein